MQMECESKKNSELGAQGLGMTLQFHGELETEGFGWMFVSIAFWLSPLYCQPKNIQVFDFLCFGERRDFILERLQIENTYLTGERKIKQSFGITSLYPKGNKRSC